MSKHRRRIIGILAGLMLLAGCGLASAQTPGDPLEALIVRVLALEENDAQQDARITALEQQVAKAQREADYARGAALFAYEEGQRDAYRLRRCGMIRDHNRRALCFYRLF